MISFGLVTGLGWASVVGLAGWQRGRAYAGFAAVLLGIHSLIAAGVYPLMGPAKPLFLYAHAATFLHFASLVRPKMRPGWYRAFVSLPASYFVAGTFLAMPWAIASAVGVRAPLAFVPYGVALLGLLDSLFGREEVVDVSLDGEFVPALRRHDGAGARVERPLRVVQITDPHLGPFMSVRRLKQIVERAVAREPDLVLLTGDFLTMESQSDPRLLAEALAPLRPLAGRTFACMGNHDHEAPEVVAAALRSAGVTLLVDDARVVETPVGDVEVVGFDYHFRNRKERLAEACARMPRREGAVMRIALLHDPGAFKHLPTGTADLVLSGHTHGGQLGLLRLGLRHTVVSALTEIPDHGLWARGKDRLYVHRGTGHYGFPLRVGVPAEQSLLNVHPVASGA